MLFIGMALLAIVVVVISIGETSTTLDHLVEEQEKLSQ